MNGLDRIEDTFPHGTVEGNRLGCKGGACPAKAAGGDSCAQAMIRYRGDWEYQKAVDAGEVPPPAIRDRPRGSKLKTATSSLIVEPTITVADSQTPPPAVEAPAAESAPAPAKKERRTWRHGTTWGYQKGCRTDADCPAFKDGEGSCRQVARAYWREQQEKKRVEGGAAPRRRQYRTVLERIVAAVGKSAPIEKRTEADGTLLVTIRIPAVRS